VNQSSPESTTKSGPQSVMTSCIWRREPAASLVPTMFLIFESLAMVSGVILTPVLLGMLYTIMGMGTFSAISL